MSRLPTVATCVHSPAALFASAQLCSYTLLVSAAGMGDSWTSATPMRNADFKALLTTPRPAGQQQQQQHHKDGGTFKHPRPKAMADPDKDKKFKRPHPKRPGKPGSGETQKEGEEIPQYRCSVKACAAFHLSCRCAHAISRQSCREYRTANEGRHLSCLRL